MISNNNLNNLFLRIIFYTFPFLLISGPFLPDLFITFTALYFLTCCFFYLNFSFFKHKLVVFFLIFYLYININSYFAYLPSMSFQTTLPYIRMIIFSIFLAYILEKVLNLKKIIFYSFLLSYIILFFDSLIQIKTGQNLLGYPIVNGRVASLFRDKLIMGSYVARTLPILLAICYLEKFKYNYFLKIFCIFLAGALVFFSAERVSLFYYIATVIVYLFLLTNKKQIIFNFGLVFFLFLILIFFKPSSTERLYKHTLAQINQNNKYLFSERHEMHFLTAYKMFLDKKFLGHGIKSFRYLCDNPRYTVKEIIIDNNKKFSPINGYVYFINTDASKEKNYYVIFLTEFEKQEFEKIADSIRDIQTNKSDFKLDEKKFRLFLSNNSILYNGPYKVLYQKVKSASPVKQGDFIYSYAEYENGCNTHPHSLHLQILSELGILGYIFLFSFFIYLIIIFLKNLINLNFNKKKNVSKNESLYCVFIVLALILSLFPVLPSGNIFNNWILSMFYFKLGFLFHYLYFYKKL